MLAFADAVAGVLVLADALQDEVRIAMAATSLGKDPRFADVIALAIPTRKLIFLKCHY